MSLLLAVPCSVGAAVAYGASTAVQHAAAHTGTGRPDARGLLHLLRQRRWLLSFGGDGVGLALHVAALATGPVALVQPLLVLAVPIALPVGQLLGGRRARAADYLACAGILVGLGIFFALLGDPGLGAPIGTGTAVIAALAALAAGAITCLAVSGGSATTRAAVYGTVAGGGFGLAAVLFGGAAAQWRVPAGSLGLAALVAALVLGALSVVLTQVAFQVGPLAASFPANEVAAPVVAVILGAVLLREDVPLGPGLLVGYLLCLALVLACTVRLAAG